MAKKTATWKTIDDSKVRHVWTWPDGSHEVMVNPAEYAESGIPICAGTDAEDAGCEGEDMIYVRTEIQS